MPVDANIPLGVKPIQFESPINQMGQLMGLQHAQSQNELGQYQLATARRADADQNALRAALQGVDISTPEGLSKARTAMLGTGNVKGAMELDKSALESRKTLSEIDKNEIANRAAKADKAVRDIANFSTRDQIIADISNKVASKELPTDKAQQILSTLPATDAELPAWQLNTLRGILSAKDRLEQHFVQRDNGSKVDTLAMPKYGAGLPAAVVPGSSESKLLAPDIVAQKKDIARAGASNISLSTEKKYGEKVADLAAVDDMTLVKLAQNAPRQIAKIDETLGILRNSDINTGIGAELFTVMDRARSQFLADEKAGKRVTSTEYLDSLLGSEVFPLIQSLGIGARGMDTPAEREFLRKVMTGTITLNKNTLIKMAELRRAATKEEVDTYNRKVDSGELDQYFAATPRKKTKIVVPDYSVPKTTVDQIPGQTPADDALFKKYGVKQ